jgi:hypothetical protein
MENEQLGETLTKLRQGVLLLLLSGMIGTAVELFLMGHTEDLDQLIPLILIGLSLVVLVWYEVSASRLSLQVLRVLMGLSVISGALGSFFHYRGNVEFEIESMPGLHGVELFKEAMSGATPVLAPGTMILIGALGLLYTLGHPRLQASSTSSGES